MTSIIITWHRKHSCAYNDTYLIPALLLVHTYICKMLFNVCFILVFVLQSSNSLPSQYRVTLFTFALTLLCMFHYKKGLNIRFGFLFPSLCITCIFYVQEKEVVSLRKTWDSWPWIEKRQICCIICYFDHWQP